MATTQIYRMYIKTTPEAIWDAITNPEWTEKYGYGGRADLRAAAGRQLPLHEPTTAMHAMGAPDIVVDGEVIESRSAAQARADLAHGDGPGVARRRLYASDV